MMVTLLIALGIFIYTILLLILIYFWEQPEKMMPQHSQEKDFISVVIPVRNEKDLPLLIEDLKNQSLASELYEIIVVDDHSDEKINTQHSDVILLRLEGSISGKKAALTKGIKEAKGGIIVTIDSDCRVGESFLKKIYSLFTNYDVILSPGLIEYRPANNLFEKMQAMETAAVMGTGVALHRKGASSLSNGANLAFKKDIWERLRGYKKHMHIASGDDMFFVQEVFTHHSDRIVYRTSSKSVVTTRPNHSLRSFFHQRLRWAGKWHHYGSFSMKAMAVGVFAAHAIICAGLIMLFGTGSAILGAAFILKLLAEGTLIYKVCKRLKAPFYPLSILLLQFIYSPYVVFFGVTANFIPYKWKGRRYSH